LNVNKDSEVITHIEAFALFVIFAFVLVILYPKEMLEKQVLAESSNYDLTVVYLENMIRIDPENTNLALALVKSSVKSGNFALALKMIEVLRKNADAQLLKELDKYQFEALKAKYFSTNEKKYQDEIIQEIDDLLQKLLESRSYLEVDLVYWYRAAREFSLYSPALEFLTRLIQRDEKLKWLEECFYLSAELKNDKQQDECLVKLQSVDEKWVERAYYLAREDGEYKRALLLLKGMSKSSIFWKKELAKFYLELQQYEKASDIFMQLYKQATSYKEKKTYFKKALQALQYGSLGEKVSTLARKYESRYYKDKHMSMYIIKIYLAFSKLDDASRVSVQRLKYIK